MSLFMEDRGQIELPFDARNNCGACNQKQRLIM